jgi:hypothetical protein
MDFSIAYNIKPLLFNKQNLEIEISNDERRKCYATYLVDKPKAFSRNKFEKVISLMCTKAALQLYKSSHEDLYEDADGIDICCYGAASYHKLNHCYVVISKLGYTDSEIQKGLTRLVYYVASVENIKTISDIELMNLGYFHHDIVDSVFNNKMILNSSLKDINNYFGEEPNYETILCSLV